MRRGFSNKELNAREEDDVGSRTKRRYNPSPICSNQRCNDIPNTHDSKHENKSQQQQQTNQRQYRSQQENATLQHCHTQPLSPIAFIPLHKTCFLSLHSDSLRNWSPPLATNWASLNPNVVLSSTLNAYPHIIWHTRIRRGSNRSVSHTPDRSIQGCVVAGAVMAGRCWRIALWREE